MIKLIPLLYESDKVLTTRRTPEERQKNYQKALEKQKVLVQKKIADYAANPKGDLELNGYDFDITLPDNLYVDGDLVLKGTKITKLPKGLKVNASIWLGRTKLKEIPADIEIGWALSLNLCKDVLQLPDGLNIPSSLYLEWSGITELPNNLTVNSSLYAEHTKVKGIGKNLKVEDDLRLDDTPLSKQYNTSQIVGMIKEKGGSVGGSIYR